MSISLLKYYPYFLPLTILFATSLQAEESQEVFFENQVRPLLAEHCFNCHGEKKQQGKLRLDRRKFVFAEGAAGTAVVPGKLDESRLWQVLQYDEFDIQMPPSGKLSNENIEILKKWIESGAYWPEESEEQAPSEPEPIPLKEDGSIDYEEVIASHWAYQPVQKPQVPEIDGAPEDPQPIDRFILKQLQQQGLTFSEKAPKQRLVRRLSFDLRGLPPSLQEVEEFVNNDDPNAFAQLVNRYLSEPTYGQRWGRYWLDLARYADTKGYVFTENRLYPYSYTYRDYVIDAFNEDKPYDTFVMEQLAADQLGYAENDPRLAALGFLTIGPRFLNRTPDIIDDRIDVVTRGLMGMTMGCARCHDHKFDPLPTTDYYSLYGVFNSTYEPDLPPLLGELDKAAPGYAEFAAELAKREKALADYKENAHNELLAKARDHLEDYFPAALKSMGILPAETKLEFKHGTPRDRLIAHWKNTLEKMAKSQNPFYIPAARLLTIPENELSEKAAAIIEELKQNPKISPIILERLLAGTTKTRLDVVQVYVSVLNEIRESWKSHLKENPQAAALPDPEQEKVRRVLYGADSLSDLAAGDYSSLFERDNRDKIRGLERKIDEWHATGTNAPPRSMVLLDKEKPANPVVFVRGNIGRRGEKVPRRGPHLLNPSPEAVYPDSSGRRELAEQIISKQNPLTARVLVNRIWQGHFGKPLVESTSDFGLRTEAPVHRELLDYLAWSLMHQHNWSLKGLHREILLSQAWQQSSTDREEARQIDPENTLYWRQNRQRLDFEAMRDAVLSAAGVIDLSLGGRAVDIEKQPFPTRRTVYAFIDRNNPSGLLRTFDFPTPNSSSPGRSQTTVPQQALYGMNSLFFAEMSGKLADRVQKAEDQPERQVKLLIELAYSRPARPEEVTMLQGYLQNSSLRELAQAVLLSNEFLFVD